MGCDGVLASLLRTEELRTGEITYEGADSLKCSLVHTFLRFTRRLKLSLWHPQRMVAGFDNVQKIRRFHLRSDTLQEIEGAQHVARALHEQNGRPQGA